MLHSSQGDTNEVNTLITTFSGIANKSVNLALSKLADNLAYKAKKNIA